uniref:hypothetical protein n=1 Tax=Prevotella sp. TaxID=59823 RepID=UPI003FEF6979
AKEQKLCQSAPATKKKSEWSYFSRSQALFFPFSPLQHQKKWVFTLFFIPFFAISVLFSVFF